MYNTTSVAQFIYAADCFFLLKIEHLVPVVVDYKAVHKMLRIVKKDA